MSNSTVWQDKAVRRYFFQTYLGASMLMIGVLLGLSGQLLLSLDRQLIVSLIGLSLDILALIPVASAIRSYRKGNVPLAGVSSLWKVAFNKPYDRFLIALAFWFVLILSLAAAVILTATFRLMTLF